MTQVLGFYGTGAASQRSINRFIPKHVGDDDFEAFVLVDDSWNASMERLLDYSIENATQVTCVIPEGDEFAEDCEEDGTPYMESSAPLREFLDALAPDGHLVLLWDDESEEAEVALAGVAHQAFDRGLRVFDLSHGMTEMEPTDDAADDEAPVEEPEEDDDMADPFQTFIDALEAAEDPDALLEVMLEKEHRDALIELGTQLGVEFNPSSWQKKIAPLIHEQLLNEMEMSGPDASILEILAAPVADPDPEGETSVPDDAGEAGKVLDATGKGHAVKAPPLEDDNEKTVEKDTMTGMPNTQNPSQAFIEEAHYTLELLNAVSMVAARQGVDAAKDFMDLLRDNGLA